MKKICSLLLILSTVACSTPAWAQIPWRQWVGQLRQQAISQGIRPTVFDRAFHNIHAPQRKVIRLDRRQPETRLTYLKYRKTRGDAYRIKLGIREYKKNRHMLNEIGQHYGVNPCFVVSLWGIESSYGRFKGHFSTIKALATLAYDARRSKYFRKELLLALHIINQGHVSLKNFKGEWAGGSGHPQFMPSSWYHYAVDYNGDGKKDIWNTYADVFASIANYLKSNGWQTSQPWGLEVRLPYGFDTTQIGYKKPHSVQQWERLGVRTAPGWHFPRQNLTAWVVHPHGGPDLMVFKNFRVVMSYNPSTFYAGTVCYMSDKICRAVR